MRRARQHRTAPLVVGILVGALAILGLTIPPWVLPPIDAKETGPAAIEMVQFADRDRENPYDAVLPEPLPPVADGDGPRAGEVYENLEVLGDVSEAEFNRLMLAITQWVAPEAGCGYCHDLAEGFASDALYTKTVARDMLRMVRRVNTEWGDHVAPSGVTCYTCHRGENVPPWTWYEQNEPGGDQFMGKPRPWHLDAKSIRQFFPDVPFEEYLMEEHATANIQSRDPLVSNDGTPEVAREQTAENLYLFMMQMADGIGVNCTYCHNSRAFFDWSQSTPYRWIAYWGIRMARSINSDYIQPLASVFPDERKGPLGDPAKVHCGTCHLGSTRPLGGYELATHYLAGLTEDGEAPDASRRQAVILGEAMPVAQTGPGEERAGPDDATPGAVSEDALDESQVPPSGGSAGETSNVSGSNQGDPAPRPNAPAAEGSGDAALGGTVEPVAPAEGEAARPPQPGDTPQSDAAPGSGPADAANAPSAGQPASGGDEPPGTVRPEGTNAEPLSDDGDAPLPTESETADPVVDEPGDGRSGETSRD